MMGAAIFRQTDPDRRAFAAILLLGGLFGGAAAAAAVVLSLNVLIPFASACIQACARDPFMMNVARGAAAVAVVASGSGLVAGGVVLSRQIRATTRLVRRVEALARPAPHRLARMADLLGISGRLTYARDREPYAFCYGFISPRICVSSGLVNRLTAGELRAVILHERFHLSRRDPLKVLASRIAAGAMYPLPVVADLRDRYLVEKELSADADATHGSSVQALAGALLKLCRYGTQGTVADLAAAAVGPLSTISVRIRGLAGAREGLLPVRSRRAVVSLVAAGLLLLLAVGSGYAAERAAPPGGHCCGQPTYCDLQN